MGLGLANVEQRLARYYGDAASLTITPAPGAGGERGSSCAFRSG